MEQLWTTSARAGFTASRFKPTVRFDIFFAACGDKVFKRCLKAKGAQGWDQPHKPASPRLWLSGRNGCFSLTPCLSWVFGSQDDQNRFNGFWRTVETVETVPIFIRSLFTQLTQGVNEGLVARLRRVCEFPGEDSAGAGTVLTERNESTQCGA